MCKNNPFMKFMMTISVTELVIAFILSNIAIFKHQLTSEHVLFMVGIGFFVGGMFTFIIGIVVGQFMNEDGNVVNN